MRDDRDYKLDLSSAPQPGTEDPSTAPTGRPFLSILFTCCHVYLRVYRNEQGTAYVARCPRCGRQVNFAVGEGGTDSRVFQV